MAFGNIIYLETGTGKTYIAIMLLKYLFSERFIDYRTRLEEKRKNYGIHLQTDLRPS